MKPIPFSLYNKLKENLQTKFNEADPRLTIMFQRSARYIEQGAMMEPFTVEDDDPGVFSSWDLAMRRENHLTGPDYMYRAHIEGGQVHVSRADWHTLIEAMSEEPGTLEIAWEDLGTFGAAGSTDCAIEFNGYWVRTSPDAEVCFDSPAQWTHVTEGEPYVFWVDSAGALHTQQLGETAVELVASGVTKISSIRGWKNVYRWNMDHGLIVAYVKSDAVYYRTYANQGTEENPLPPAWETERAVVSLPSPAQDVAVFRTNDFRTGFLVEHNGEIHWSITDRNWAGMAIQDHTITARGTGLDVDFIAIVYEEGFHAHTIEAQGTEVAAMLCPPLWPSVDTIYNPEDEEEEPIVDVIYIALTLDIYGDGTGLESALTVTDEIGTNYNVISTAKGPTNNILTLHTENFEGASGDLTVDYDFSTVPIYSQVEGGCLMELDSFNIAFTPTIAPPEGYTSENITIAGTELAANFIVVTYENGHSEDTITVEGTEVFVDFIHTDEIVT